MYYLANFEIDEGNENLKDLGRAGVTVAGVGGGAFLGAEAGGAIAQNNLQSRLKYLKDADKIEETKEALQGIEEGRLIQSSRTGKNSIKRKFEPKRLFAGNFKPKALGAAVGALGGYVVASSLGNKLLPNERYNDEILREQRADKRKEAGRINRSSEEIRGWSNLARRLSTR